MTESAPEWQQNIINTGEKWKKDSAEKAAIDFIESHKKAGMPPERLNKLIDAITKLLKQKAHDKDTVLRGCEEALRTLWWDIKIETEKKEITKARESCIRNRFDPANINGEDTLHYFECISKNPEEQLNIQKAFEQDTKLYAGFIRYALLQKREGWVSHKSNIVILWGEKNAWVQWMDKKIVEFSNNHKSINLSDLELSNNHATGIGNIVKSINESNQKKLEAKSIEWVWKKASNIGTGLAVDAEIQSSRIFNSNWREHKILEYDGTNSAVTIGTFEKRLKSIPIQDINSRGFAEYLKYLAESKAEKFTFAYLKETIGEQKLWNLAILWNIGNEDKGNRSATLAQSILKNDGKIEIISTFSSILEKSMQERAVHIEHLKEFSSFPKTELFLRRKGLILSTDELSNILRSGSLSKIILWLKGKNVQLKTEQDAKDLYQALQDDSCQQIKKIELDQKSTNINGREVVNIYVKTYSLSEKKLAPLLKKQLQSLSSEELLILQTELTTSKDPGKEKLEKWIKCELKKRPAKALHIKASAAVESKQIQKVSVDLSQGKKWEKQFEKIEKAWVAIYVQKEKIKSELWNESDLFESYLKDIGYTMKDLLGSSVARKEVMKLLNSKEALTDTEKKLQRILQSFVLNEQRSTSFESGWVAKLEKFDQEYSQKWGSNWEKTDKEAYAIQWSIGGIPFQKIDNGKPYTISLDRQSETADTVTVKKQGDKYIVQIGGNTKNTTELSKEMIPAYIQSLQFMEKLGLGYFIRNLPGNELSDVLELTSKDTVRVNNKDGKFEEDEKKRIISSFGKLLGIKWADNIHSTDGSKLFQDCFKNKSSIEDILSSKELMDNNILKIENLKTTMKSL